MNPTDEELLHAFYAGETVVLNQLSERHSSLLEQLANLILRTRTGSSGQGLSEWDIEDRVTAVWEHVLMTRQVAFGSWPHQRLSALTWLIHLICLEMDRHLGLRPPF